MFKSIYLVNNLYLERLQCQLQFQTPIFQPKAPIQTSDTTCLGGKNFVGVAVENILLLKSNRNMSVNLP